MTATQAAVVLAVLATAWTCLGAVFFMQWQLQRYVEAPFKLRMTPLEIREILRTHARIFPQSTLRKVAATSCGLFGISLLALLILFIHP
jgi:hypothetical protein